MPKIPQHASSGKARKPREMTWDAIDSMLEAGCSGAQIAAFYGISDQTLFRYCEADKGCGFVAYKQQKKQAGESLLLHKMYSQAMSGDKTLQIWLSKQMLNMRDIPKEADADTQPITKIVITYADPENAEPSDG
jgi:hypothetical protein